LKYFSRKKQRVITNKPSKMSQSVAQLKNVIKPKLKISASLSLEEAMLGLTLAPPVEPVAKAATKPKLKIVVRKPVPATLAPATLGPATLAGALDPEPATLAPATLAGPTSMDKSIWLSMRRAPRMKMDPIIWEHVEDISDDENDTPQAAGKRLSKMKATRDHMQRRAYERKFDEYQCAGLFLNWSKPKPIEVHSRQHHFCAGCAIDRTTSILK
jgi:hypothetical protein